MSKVRLGIVDGIEYVIEQSDLEASNKAYNEHLKESSKKRSLSAILFKTNETMNKDYKTALIDSIKGCGRVPIINPIPPRKRPITRNKRKHIKP